MRQFTKIKANYSSKLDNMADYIRGFLSQQNDQTVILRTHKGIDDFCYNNTVCFKRLFLKRVGIKQLLQLEPKKSSTTEFHKFIKHLAASKGECVFLLRDAYDALHSYQKMTGKGLGILVNRDFLCRDEEDYFLLVSAVYEALQNAQSMKGFITNYMSLFDHLVHRNSHFENRAREIANYVASYSNSPELVFVDLGFQFTFVLFCMAATRRYARRKVKANFYNYSCYPWLQSFFAEHIFSFKSEEVMELEIQAITQFKLSLEEKASGALVGFAIGDALGFPVAGIDKRDIHRFLRSKITRFSCNPKHPFFSHLKKGQYTDNTSLLMLSAQHVIKNSGFNIKNYVQALRRWGRAIERKSNMERWAGPTALAAIRKLMAGHDHLTSGSIETQSCSSAYRVIPLGVHYRPFTKCGFQLGTMAETSAIISHNSNVSKFGSVIVAHVIANLMHNVSPERSILGTLGYLDPPPDCEHLIKNIKKAIILSKKAEPEIARKVIGTGSPIYQTLPMAVYCFLRYLDNYKQGLIEAANSYRDDTPQEKYRLKNLSWEQQLQEAKGGNTDGIAGITGAFLGAHLGYANIPPLFLQIENRDKLLEIARKLV